ncbi:MarR family transcriptional regulator [Mycobacterium shigaense]|uniref:Uncharacterized protein n=1 Tax=Mycobacterium shigaense TaxID=722731 RepID=A0A1Z4EM26_9MYCO|nr:MarR family transcriptional regulator [Mycobacterium shigaense]PRI14726.1 MarR family transcriptional regulator [Mycobacterium shigaense]BAX94015.1 hypothetical protein MSG_03889 [Mycobacterium shigaense]
MIELKVLQAVRLKGRIDPGQLAATVGEDPAAVTEAVTAAARAGFLVENKMLRLSAQGRTRLSELLAAEREHIDGTAVEAVYDEFRAVNTEFKALVTDWQLKNREPNAHDDAEYDAAVLARLADVHARVVPIIRRAATQLPRLSAYSVKLVAALDNLEAGDTTWLTRPLIDSYHTVWFELHEELIGAAGLTREEAARSGDAH